MYQDQRVRLERLATPNINRRPVTTSQSQSQPRFFVPTASTPTHRRVAPRTESPISRLASQVLHNYSPVEILSHSRRLHELDSITTPTTESFVPSLPVLPPSYQRARQTNPISRPSIIDTGDSARPTPRRSPLLSPGKTRNLKGVALVARKFKKDPQLFIPSTMNFFAGLQYEKVKVDDGADGVLLFIPPRNKFPNFLGNLTEKFPNETFRLVEINAISNKVPALEITSTSAFSMTLCTDIIPQNVRRKIPFHGLRFALCGEDIRKIVDRNQPHLVSLKRKIIASDTIGKAQDWLSRGFNAPRRTHALIGQSVINNDLFFGNHEARGIRIFYTTEIDPATTITRLHRISISIMGQLDGEDNPEYKRFLEELSREPNEEASMENYL
jgi:hypothetical protein